MSKKEARIARKNAKRIEQQRKSARLLAAPSEDKNPRRKVDPGSIYHMMMEWTEDSADLVGIWSWGQDRDWGQETWDTVIHPKLREYQQLLWREIEASTTDSGRRSHHPMDCDVICGECQRRLEELGLFHDSIYRFRLGNLRRLWGFRVVNSFEILWYDPEHQVYPLDPD